MSYTSLNSGIELQWREGLPPLSVSPLLDSTPDSGKQRDLIRSAVTALMHKQAIRMVTNQLLKENSIAEFSWSQRKDQTSGDPSSRICRSLNKYMVIPRFKMETSELNPINLSALPFTGARMGHQCGSARCILPSPNTPKVSEVLPFSIRRYSL